MEKDNRHIVPSHFDLPSISDISNKVSSIWGDVKEYGSAGIDIITGANPVNTAASLASLGTTQGIKSVTGQNVTQAEAAQIKQDIAAAGNQELTTSVRSLFGSIFTWLIIALLVLFFLNKLIK